MFSVYLGGNRRWVPLLYFRHFTFRFVTKLGKLREKRDYYNKKNQYPIRRSLHLPYEPLESTLSHGNLFIPGFLKTGLAKISTHSTTWQFKTTKLLQRPIKSLYLTPGSKLVVPRSIATSPNLK